MQVTLFSEQKKKKKVVLFFSHSTMTKPRQIKKILEKASLESIVDYIRDNKGNKQNTWP